MRELLRDPVLLLAFGFGSGLSPKAPGTMGTLVALPLAWGMLLLPLVPRLAVVLAVSLAGVWICQRASERLGVHDHPGIVWDEFAGLLLTVLIFPLDPVTLIGGFVAFRAFDILKPPPIGVVDRRVHGGLGIMLDDLLAAVFAAAALAAVRWGMGVSIFQSSLI